MVGYLWSFIITISIIFGILTGNIENLNNGLFDSIDKLIKLMLTLIGTICFWNGIMNILKNTRLVIKIEKIIYPIINFLFPKINKNSLEYKYISMNFISNLFGIGNAATPLGLKAIEELNMKNNYSDRLSDYMCMLIVINTASIQIVPTTIIAIRKNLNSQNIIGIFIPIWLSTFFAAIAGIFVLKLIIKITNCKG